MMAVHLVGEVCHFCYECEKYYRGHFETKDALAEDFSEGTLMEDIRTYEVYYCGDPAGPCELEEPPNQYAETWMCGNCEEIHPTAADAITCCQE